MLGEGLAEDFYLPPQDALQFYFSLKSLLGPSHYFSEMFNPNFYFEGTVAITKKQYRLDDTLYLFVCLFVYLFLYLFICLFIYLFICLFVCLFVYLFICLFVCLFICFYLFIRFVCLSLICFLFILFISFILVLVCFTE